MGERENNGRFAKGNGCANGHNGKGTGRPSRDVEERFIGVLRRVVSEQDWETVVLVALAGAKSGKDADRQLLSDWLQGKAPVQVEHSGAVEVWLAWNDAADGSSAEPA